MPRKSWWYSLLYHDSKDGPPSSPVPLFFSLSSPFTSPKLLDMQTLVSLFSEGPALQINIIHPKQSSLSKPVIPEGRNIWSTIFALTSFSCINRIRFHQNSAASSCYDCLGELLFSFIHSYWFFFSWLFSFQIIWRLLNQVAHPDFSIIVVLKLIVYFLRLPGSS